MHHPFICCWGWTVYGRAKLVAGEESDCGVLAAVWDLKGAANRLELHWGVTRGRFPQTVYIRIWCKLSLV
jgi:hypothetical protein